MVGAGCWGVGFVTRVKIVKIVEMVGACGWGVALVYPYLAYCTIENSLELCLEYGLCTTSENCQNSLGLDWSLGWISLPRKYKRRK